MRRNLRRRAFRRFPPLAGPIEAGSDRWWRQGRQILPCRVYGPIATRSRRQPRGPPADRAPRPCLAARPLRQGRPPAIPAHLRNDTSRRAALACDPTDRGTASAPGVLRGSAARAQGPAGGRREEAAARREGKKEAPDVGDAGGRRECGFDAAASKAGAAAPKSRTGGHCGPWPFRAGNRPRPESCSGSGADG